MRSDDTEAAMGTRSAKILFYASCIILVFVIHLFDAGIFSSSKLCETNEMPIVCSRNWFNSVGNFLSASIALAAASFTYGQFRASKIQSATSRLPILTLKLTELETLERVILGIQKFCYMAELNIGMIASMTILLEKESAGMTQIYDAVREYIDQIDGQYRELMSILKSVPYLRGRGLTDETDRIKMAIRVMTIELGMISTHFREYDLPKSGQMDDKRIETYIENIRLSHDNREKHRTDLYKIRAKSEITFGEIVHQRDELISKMGSLDSN